MFGRILVLAVVLLVVWGVVARTSDGARPEQVYVVRPHDTLWTIAARFYDGDPREGVWTLRERNRLGGTLLVPGQRLRVPAG
jgi:nucleoid-associated protein YgaU